MFDRICDAAWDVAWATAIFTLKRAHRVLRWVDRIGA